MIYGWTPGIGDPDFLGWFTVVAYALAAWLSWRASGRDRRSERLWFWLCIALVLLGINKQLDLQSMMTAIGRHFAKVDHWYGERGKVQEEFILLILAGAACVSVMTLLAVRRRTAGLQIAAIGFIMLCAFIVVRASSFHKMDAFIHTRTLNIYWNHWLELGGIGIISAGALLARPTSQRRRGRHSARVAEEELDDPEWLRPASRTHGRSGR